MKETKAEMLGDSRGIKKSRIIGNNTLEIEWENGERTIRLHQTDIVKFKENGDIVLNSGGWKTVTTKERINRYSPVPVHQKSREWYIGDYRFQDGITIKKDGKIEGGLPIALGEKDKRLKKGIKKYALLCSEAVPMSPPNGGDCWYCLMKTESGETLGEMAGDKEHIKSHIEEGYVVPSLVYQALLKHHNAPIIVSGTFQDAGEWITGLCRGAVKKAVEKYVSRQFGLVA